MRSLISALMAFSLWLLVHLVVWRVRRPAGQYTTLIALCLAVLVASLGSFYVAQLGSHPGFLPITALDYWSYVVLYAALALSYMTTYSAVQADSPTMTILLRIEQAGPEGLGLEEMVSELNDHILVGPRLDDLVTGNLVRHHRGRYVIGPKGMLLARAQIFYRGLLKMEKGG